MKNKSQQEMNQDLVENTYSNEFANEIFSVAEAACGTTAFTEKKRRLESKYNGLIDRYYDAFEPFVFKICVSIFAGVIILAVIALGLVIHYKSQLGIMLASIFFGGFTGGLLAYLFATGLRFFLFKVNYKATKKLYTEVKSVAEGCLPFGISLVDTGFNVNGFEFAFLKAIEEKDCICGGSYGKTRIK